MRWAAPSLSPPWSGWATRRRSRNWRWMSSDPGTTTVGAVGQAEHAERPLHRIAEGVGGPVAAAVEARQVGDEHVVERTRPAHALADRVHHPGPSGERQLPGGVDGGEDVLGGGALVLELEGEVLALADEAVEAARRGRCGPAGTGGAGAAAAPACPPGAGG